MTNLDLLCLRWNSLPICVCSHIGSRALQRPWREISHKLLPVMASSYSSWWWGDSRDREKLRSRAICSFSSRHIYWPGYIKVQMSPFPQIFRVVSLQSPWDILNCILYNSDKFGEIKPLMFVLWFCSKSSFGQMMTPEEQKALKEEVRRFSMGDVSEWLQGLDREFLTVLRTE